MKKRRGRLKMWTFPASLSLKGLTIQVEVGVLATRQDSNLIIMQVAQQILTTPLTANCLRRRNTTSTCEASRSTGAVREKELVSRHSQTRPRRRSRASRGNPRTDLASSSARVTMFLSSRYATSRFLVVAVPVSIMNLMISPPRSKSPDNY